MLPIKSFHPPISDLHPLQLTDQQRFKEAITAGGQKGWYYFFPYLLFVRLGSQSSRMVWTEDQGSICLFKHQYGHNKRLDLVFPPFPYQEGPLRRSLERMNDFNQANSSRIYFIDAQDLPQLQALNAFSFSPRNPQYLYASQELAELRGSRFRTLRRNISLARRLADIVVESYRLEHAGQCRQLLQLWERTQGVKHHVPVYQHRYALNAFHFAPQMDDRDLHGLVFLVNGQTRAFAFGGEIRKGLGCSLLGIADPAVTSLSYVMSQEQLTRNQECYLYNDGSDAGQSGLREYKQRFRPSGLHETYAAKQVARFSPRSVSFFSYEQAADNRSMSGEKPAPLCYNSQKPEDKHFLHSLKSILMAPAHAERDVAEIDRLFARTSFPQSFFRLIFVLTAVENRRILISRSVTGKRLPFSKVLKQVLRHPRRIALCKDRFEIQMDFLVDQPLSLICMADGSFQIPRQDFTLGWHGLVIRGSDGKIRLFLPSDSDLFAIKDLQGLESHLINKYELKYLQNAELEYFQTSCFVAQNGSWVVRDRHRLSRLQIPPAPEC